MARLFAILKSDPTWLEVISTVFLALWAALLLSPYSTFESSPSYGSMDFVPEWVWGVIALAFAVIGFVGLFKNHRSTRLFALLCGQFFWGTVGACVLLANPGSTGGWIYMALAQACMTVYILAGRHPWKT